MHFFASNIAKKHIFESFLGRAEADVSRFGVSVRLFPRFWRPPARVPEPVSEQVRAPASGPLHCWYLWRQE